MAVVSNLFQGYQQRPNNRPSNQSSEQQQPIGGGPMLNSSASQQYQQNMINTATPQELTLMLYNGLVRFLKLAIQGVEEKNYEKTNNYIIRSEDIISEFMCTLDMKYEISNSLMSLYDYMRRRLLEANLKKDKAILQEVLGFAEELRDTWAQAMRIAKQQQAVNK